MESSHQKKQAFFDVIQSKAAFWMGFGTAILTIGTLGFIILGTCMMRGTCAADSLAVANKKAAPAVVVPTDTTQPLPAAAVPAITEDDHIRGNKNAEITIVEYSDFECPFCGAFHPTLSQAMDQYKDQVRWVYRHFPLSFHPQAQPAALASECAGEQGKFWEFADNMFANQSLLNDTYFKKVAADLKLNTNQFNTCLDTQKYLSKIQDQAQTGGAAGVDGTPGTFIIGPDGTATPLKGAVPFASVAAEIDKLLK